MFITKKRFAAANVFARHGRNARAAPAGLDDSRADADRQKPRRSPDVQVLRGIYVPHPLARRWTSGLPRRRAPASNSLESLKPLEKDCATASA